VFRAITLAALVVATALAGGGLAAGAGPGDEVTVAGTVTAVDGGPAADAAVLIGDDGDLTERSTTDLRRLAERGPGELELTVVRTDDEGRFETRVPWGHASAAVVVSDEGVSDLHRIRRENATLDVALYERRPQTIHAHLGGVAHDETRAELFVNLDNSDDATLRNLTVELAALPEGWSVATVETAGRYDATSRTLTWAAVAPGDGVDTTVVLAVPDGTAPGEYVVDLRARSDDHRIGVAPETVEVLPEETAGPTTAPARTPTAAGTPSPTPTDAAAPGAGVAAALTAFACLVALFGARS
jgi:hypothetical protein